MLILSTKYGLIDASTPIANYDQRMNRDRAGELKNQTVQALQSYAGQNTYCEVYVDLGQDYYPAIGDLQDIFDGSLITYAEGRIGERLKRLKQWLITKCKSDVVFF